MESTGDTSSTPLWVSHHHEQEHHRCVRWRGRYLCRRCLVLYPVALAVMSLVLVADIARSTGWLLVVLPVPAVVEWWAEHLDRWSYRARRQVATTLLAGVALGSGFARYLRDPLDPWFWAMVVVYGGSCAGVALWRLLDERAP